VLTRRIRHSGMRRGEQFEEVVEKAKIPTLRWHDLRHTFASRPAMAGVPLHSTLNLFFRNLEEPQETPAQTTC